MTHACSSVCNRYYISFTQLYSPSVKEVKKISDNTGLYFLVSLSGTHWTLLFGHHLVLREICYLSTSRVPAGKSSWHSNVRSVTFVNSERTVAPILCTALTQHLFDLFFSFAVTLLCYLLSTSAVLVNWKTSYWAVIAFSINVMKMRS